MKIFLIAISTLAAAVIFAADPFVLPPAAKVINRDHSGKTWQLNAALNMPLANAKAVLHHAILQQNYTLKHEIPIDEKGQKHIIISYVKGKDNLILMLWSLDGKKTFFSYGVAR